jgi:hypothetical protein
MASKLSDLLDSQRLRPLWQRRSVDTASAPRASVPGGQETPESAAHLGADLGGAYLSGESPHAVLAALDAYLRQELGAGCLLLGHLMHPLRAAVARVDPSATPPPAHPLQQATPLPLHDLIDRLDDALTGLLPFRRPTAEEDAREDLWSL